MKPNPANIHYAEAERANELGGRMAQASAPAAVTPIDVLARNVWGRITQPDAAGEVLLDDDVQLAIQNTRDNFKVLGTAIAAPGLAPEAAAALKIVDQQLYDRIEAEQKAEIGRLGAKGFMSSLSILRSTPGFTPSWRALSPSKALLNLRVQNEINRRFAGNTLTALSADDQNLVRELLAQLAPTATLFRPQELRDWINDAAQDDLRKQLIELVGVKNIRVVPTPPGTPPPPAGAPAPQIQTMSDSMIPLIAYIRGTTDAKTHVQLEHGTEIGGDVAGLRAEWDTIRNLLTSATPAAPSAQKTRDNQDARLKTQKEEAERYKAAATQLDQLIEQEQKRLVAQQARDRAVTAHGLATKSKELAQLQGTIDQRQSEYDAATTKATSLRTRFVSRYNKPPIDALITAQFATIGGFATATFPVNIPAHGTDLAKIEALKDTLEDTHDTQIQAFQTAQKDWDLQKTAPFDDVTDPPPAGAAAGTTGPIRTAGYTTFTELEEAEKTARTAYTAAGQTVRTRSAQGKILDPLDLLRRLQLHDPALQTAGTKEEQEVRAVVSTLLLKDMADSHVQKGAAMRTAQRVARSNVSALDWSGLVEGTRRRLKRAGETKTRLSFDVFVKQSLISDSRFSKLGDLKLDTDEKTIAGWLGTDDQAVLTRDKLYDLIQQVDAAGNDRLGGAANLAFNEDVRPLLRRLKSVYYTDLALDKMKQTPAIKQDELLTALLGELHSKPPTPALSLEPESVITNRKRIADLTAAVEAAKTAGAGVEEAEKALKIFERFGKFAVIGHAALEVGKLISKAHQAWKNRASGASSAPSPTP